ncbi:MAG: hypothetical protein ACI3Z9_07775 [Candidatus Onthomorpha sp.]
MTLIIPIVTRFPKPRATIVPEYTLSAILIRQSRTQRQGKRRG